jgi:uncharacterized integral membrane protein (TIGR00698 family)
LQNLQGKVPSVASLNEQKLSKILLPIAGLICLLPFISSAEALLLGLAIALSLGNPYSAWTKQHTSQLLSYSVIGLGAGMNLLVVARVGVQGFGYTVLGILSAFAIGSALGRLLKVNQNTSLLITVGTAICGGSAIAAAAPVMRAKSHEVSVALGTVFLLNACALVIFPLIGHSFAMSETQFGLWSALAIHDTSSVVGASMQYGAHALEVGTTVKLARALWIVPVTFAIGLMMNRRDGGRKGAKAKRPWFILGFLVMAALVTFVPALQPAGHVIESIAKRLLVLTLFLIGANLSRETLRTVGFRPFVQGVVLWAVMASGSLALILRGWISG